MLQTFRPPFGSCDVSIKSESTVYSHERPRGDRSCLHRIGEETAVTNKERSREESFVRGRLGSRGTELYRAVRSLRLEPTAAGRLILIDLRRGERYRREVSNVQKND